MRLNSQVLDIVRSKYKVVDIIDLYDVDRDMSRVLTMLEKYRDYEFKDHERLIFLHHDTDYYITLDSSGFSIYNLIMILSHLSIPGEFVIMFTNHYGIEQEVNKQYKLFGNFSPMTVVYTALWYDFPYNVEPTPSISGNIEKLYCCLNGKQRHHRMMLLCYLKEYNLLDNGIVSYFFGDTHSDA